MRLDDGDSPIAEAVLGAIPPKGRAPFKQWHMKNRDAASTRLTVTVGGQCFTHVVTKKND